MRISISLAMPFWETLLFAVGLAMDAFAVSVAAVSSGRSKGPRAFFRLAFHFGLFQALMPIAGWLAGRTVAQLIVAVDHWVAFGLLTLIGGKMTWSGLHPNQEDTTTNGKTDDPSRGWSLVSLSVATSIDAFAVGLSLALLQVSIWYPAVVIGLVTGALSLLGIWLGRHLGLWVGPRMEVIGGVILGIIGLRILFSHLGA